jgi:hypothetical protein
LTHVPITDILLDVQAHNTLYITFCLDKWFNICIMESSINEVKKHEK